MDFNLNLSKLRIELDEIVSQYGKYKNSKKLSESSDQEKKLFYEDDQSSVLTVGIFNNQGIPIFSAGASTMKADSLRILGGQFSRMINSQQQIGDQLMKIKLQKCSKPTTKDRLNTAGSGDLLKDDDCLKTKSISDFYKTQMAYISNRKLIEF